MPPEMKFETTFRKNVMVAAFSDLLFRSEPVVALTR
jgi:hypothetical protein